MELIAPTIIVVMPQNLFIIINYKTCFSKLKNIKLAIAKIEKKQKDDIKSGSIDKIKERRGLVSKPSTN